MNKSRTRSNSHPEKGGTMNSAFAKALFNWNRSSFRRKLESLFLQGGAEGRFQLSLE
jgi:hypothetical protein